MACNRKVSTGGTNGYHSCRACTMYMFKRCNPACAKLGQLVSLHRQQCSPVPLRHLSMARAFFLAIEAAPRMPMPNMVAVLPNSRSWYYLLEWKK